MKMLFLRNMPFRSDIFKVKDLNYTIVWSDFLAFLLLFVCLFLNDDFSSADCEETMICVSALSETFLLGISLKHFRKLLPSDATMVDVVAYLNGKPSGSD